MLLQAAGPSLAADVRSAGRLVVENLVGVVQKSAPDLA